MFTKLALSRTGNVYELLKVSSSSSNFSFYILSCILTQTCSLYLSHYLLTHSSDCPSTQISSSFFHITILLLTSAASPNVMQDSQDRRGEPGIVSGCSTVDSSPYIDQDKPIRAEPSTGIASPHTDCCCLDKCLSPNPRLTNTWKAAGATREH